MHLATKHSALAVDALDILVPRVMIASGESSNNSKVCGDALFVTEIYVRRHLAVDHGVAVTAVMSEV